MRLNKFIAQATGLSRRAADRAIQGGQVTINGQIADLGTDVQPPDSVQLSGKPLTFSKPVAIMLNKPPGYVCSRRGQGSRTVYDLLPPEYHELKTVGRLDKDSSGLLLLTNDGDLANRLTHPRYAKAKIYQVELGRPLAEADKTQLATGVQLEDGVSSLELKPGDATLKNWQITMTEGRNRQIRRTFGALGYTVNRLHRTHFGQYQLGTLKSGAWQEV